MTNAYYNHGAFPAQSSAGSSASMRAELDLITAGFNKLPTLTANNIIFVNSSGTALEPRSTINAIAIGGTTPAAGAFTTLSSSGAATLTSLTVSGATALGNTTITGTLSGITDLTTTGNTILGDAVGDTLNVAAGSLQVSAGTLILNTGVSANAFHQIRVNNVVIGYYGSRDGLVGSGGTLFGLRAESDLFFAAGGASERMRIMNTGPVVVNATTNTGVGAGTDRFAVNGTIGTSGSQFNVNPASDYEMVHRGAGGWWFYTDTATKVPLKVDRLAATNTLQLTSAGVAIGGDGRLYGLSLHNNAGAVTGTTNQYIASGTYTPTITSVSNIDSTTAKVCQWARVGNVVTVSGAVAIDATLDTSDVKVGISLPIASALTIPEQLGGAGGASNGASYRGAVLSGDATNDRAEMFGGAGFNTSVTWNFSFTYVIV